MRDSKKYTVTLPISVAAKLDYLSDKNSMSKPEVLRRAISLLSYVEKELCENNKLCIIGSDSKIIKEVVLT